MNRSTSARTLWLVAVLPLLCGCPVLVVDKELVDPPYSPRDRAKDAEGVDLALVGAAYIGRCTIWTYPEDMFFCSWTDEELYWKRMGAAAKLGADYVEVRDCEYKKIASYGKGGTFESQRVMNASGSYSTIYIPHPEYYEDVYATGYHCWLYRIASDAEERRRIRSDAFVERMETSHSAGNVAKLLEAGIADPGPTMHRAMGALLQHLGSGSCENTENDFGKLKLLLRSHDLRVTSIAYWMFRTYSWTVQLGTDIRQSAKPDLDKKRSWDCLNKAHSLLANALRDRPAAGPLIAALKDQNRIMRGAAAYALGKYFPETRAVRPLIGALNDSEWLVRGLAAWALGQIGAEAAIPALTELSKDKDSRVRNEAAAALTKIRGK